MLEGISNQGESNTDAQPHETKGKAVSDHAHSHSHAHNHQHTHADEALQPHSADAVNMGNKSAPTHANYPRQAAEHTWHRHSVNHKTAGSMTQQYFAHSHQRFLWLMALLAAMLGIALFAIRYGAYPISLQELIGVFLGQGEGATEVAIWRIRLPRVVGALVCGWGLALSGLSIQTLLKNPLASPSTIGISQGAAFGAAASIVLLEAQMYMVTVFAFAGAMGATVVVLILASLKRMSTEAVVLSGVALSSLFTSGTILVQFLASDTELAMVVFWTFGDVARASWQEIGLMAIGVAVASIFLFSKRWDLNALISGEEAAKGLGVNVGAIRMTGVVTAALVAALATAFFGVIAFVGLVAPHIARRLVGADHRLSLPFSCVLGSLLLLTSDTIGRVIIGTGSLPVGVITSCLGAPMFLYMLVKSYR